MSSMSNTFSGVKNISGALESCLSTGVTAWQENTPATSSLVPQVGVTGVPLSLGFYHVIREGRDGFSCFKCDLFFPVWLLAGG